METTNQQELAASWCSFPKCRKCKAPYRKTVSHHVYCSGLCRQQAYRDRNAKHARCLACGEPVVNRRYCNSTCGARFRRWAKDGRMFRCHNQGCARCNVSMIHAWDAAAGAWKCNGCGQLQWW